MILRTFTFFLDDDDLGGGGIRCFVPLDAVPSVVAGVVAIFALPSPGVFCCAPPGVIEAPSANISRADASTVIATLLPPPSPPTAALPPSSPSSASSAARTSIPYQRPLQLQIPPRSQRIRRGRHLLDVRQWSAGDRHGS